MILFLNDTVSTDASFFETTPFFPISFESSGVPLPPSAPPSTPIAPLFSTSNFPPLQVFSHRRKRAPPFLPPPTMLSLSEIPTNHLLDSDLPITLRKGKRSCTLYLTSTSKIFDYLLSSFRSFVESLSSISIPRTYQEAQSDPRWR